MTVGDLIEITPTVDGVKRKPVMGRVVYIHSKRRYYTVEYQLPGGGTLRESFRYRYRKGEL